MTGEAGVGAPLGRVVGGSFSEGLTVKLDGGAPIEDMAVGRYTVIQGGSKRFFGMVTDVSLESSDARLSAFPPDPLDPFVAEVLAGTALYGGLKVTPMLTIGLGDKSGVEGPQPVRTIPPHFSRVTEASEEDMARVFGSEDERHFYVGNPLDMETKVCLDLGEFAKRSNGVFGKSGTGKTFLTRLLLAGSIQKGTAVNLVFDMHSEYGWEGRSEERYKVKGLKQLFPSKVAVFTLDPDSSRRRKVSTDYDVKIGYDEIEPEDISLLRETLNLSQVAAEAAYMLERKYGKGKWLERFLNMGEGLAELADEINVNPAALAALLRRLEILRRMDFLTPQGGGDAVKQILDHLARGVSVVLEFGRYETNLAAYILVANLLTRRIHDQYVRRAEMALGDGGADPERLMITIEEAHKFLGPGLSGQTTFGVIAREMRKVNVTLLVIDQRPSGIDEEVMSQIGTKICCLLDNERDVDRVLSGVSGGRQLKTVLAGLDSNRQALIFGHSVPMPVVIQTREYGTPEFYKSMQAPMAAARAGVSDAGPPLSADDLWGAIE